MIKGCVDEAIREILGLACALMVLLLALAFFASLYTRRDDRLKYEIEIAGLKLRLSAVQYDLERCQNTNHRLRAGTID